MLTLRIVVKAEGARRNWKELAATYQATELGMVACWELRQSRVVLVRLVLELQAWLQMEAQAPMVVLPIHHCSQEEVHRGKAGSSREEKEEKEEGEAHGCQAG